MMKRRNSFRPIRDTLASIEDMNRKLRDSGNVVSTKRRSVLKNGFDQRAMIERKAFIKHQLRGSVTRPTVDTGPRLPSPRIY